MNYIKIYFTQYYILFFKGHWKNIDDSEWVIKYFKKY